MFKPTDNCFILVCENSSMMKILLTRLEDNGKRSELYNTFCNFIKCLKFLTLCLLLACNMKFYDNKIKCNCAKNPPDLANEYSEEKYANQ